MRILPRLEDLQREPVIFHGDQAANGLPERFITQDEIDMVLRHGVTRTGSDYRLDIYAFFRSHSDLKEREKYLKDKYGIGGGSGGNDNTSYNAHVR